MARKRGGLAGIWDRNKKIIKPLATGVAGLLTGGTGGAIVGGLMSGLDREGRRGIGFDLGQGAKGAATGYALGSLAGAAGAKMNIPQYNIGGKIASKLPFMKASTATPSGPLAANAPPSMGTEQVGYNFFSPGASLGSTPAQSGGSRISGLLKGAKENWDVISGIGNAVGGVMQSQSQEAIANQNASRLQQELALREREFEDRRRREEEARENRRRITMLLMPVLQKELAAYGSPTTPTMG